MLEFRITNGQRLSRIDGSTVSAGTTDLYAHFSFGDNYNGVVTSYWRVKGEKQTYKAPLDAEGICLVPWEVLASVSNNELIYQDIDHYVSVSIADADVTTSSECEFAVKRTAYSMESFDPENPPTDAYQKLIDMINAGQLRGESAYEAAVEIGYTGSKEEWIKSLEGKKGEPFTLEDFERTEAYQTILEQEEKRQKDTEEAIKNVKDAEKTAREAAEKINAEIKKFETSIKSGKEEDAEWHLGFYLDEDGDLCQKEE